MSRATQWRVELVQPPWHTGIRASTVLPSARAVSVSKRISTTRNAPASCADVPHNSCRAEVIVKA